MPFIFLHPAYSCDDRVTIGDGELIAVDLNLGAGTIELQRISATSQSRHGVAGLDGKLLFNATLFPLDRNLSLAQLGLDDELPLIRIELDPNPK